MYVMYFSGDCLEVSQLHPHPFAMSPSQIGKNAGASVWRALATPTGVVFLCFEWADFQRFDEQGPDDRSVFFGTERFDLSFA